MPGFGGQDRTGGRARSSRLAPGPRLDPGALAVIAPSGGTEACPARAHRDPRRIRYFNTYLSYRGIAPAGGPPPGNPATAEPSNASNRVESISFAEAGDYLVICNVRPHFVDGMVATIKVR
ncbi:hypothetical protein [Ideonella sp. A 288]|uniref:hypothetical protein n=1 Tax=Ideonella sp. A 288 TaxID=1962181 RepID=UPI001185DBCE|nr:hypothetical protein [Ideonella sp. A 288]